LAESEAIDLGFGYRLIACTRSLNWLQPAGHRGAEPDDHPGKQRHKNPPPSGTIDVAADIPPEKSGRNAARGGPDDEIVIPAAVVHST